MSPWTPPGVPYPPQGNVIHWELAWKGALLAGAAAALLTAIPYISLGCCLWMLGGGVLSVALYQRRVPGTSITPGMGLKLGALAGIFGFVINAVITTASFVMFRSSNPDFRRAFEEQMQKSVAGNPDPKVHQMMQRIMEFMSSPQGMATLIVAMLIVLAVVFVVFTAAGGALGASMSGRRRQFR